MFKWISDMFLKVLKTVKSILFAVFTASFQLLLEKLKNIATASIIRLASTDLSNSEKREQAFSDIKGYAIKQAITFTDSDLNLIIEIIYKQLKNDGVVK